MTDETAAERMARMRDRRRRGVVPVTVEVPPARVDDIQECARVMREEGDKSDVVS